MPRLTTRMLCRCFSCSEDHLVSLVCSCLLVSYCALLQIGAEAVAKRAAVDVQAFTADRERLNRLIQSAADVLVLRDVPWLIRSEFCVHGCVLRVLVVQKTAHDAIVRTRALLAQDGVDLSGLTSGAAAAAKKDEIKGGESKTESKGDSKSGSAGGAAAASPVAGNGVSKSVICSSVLVSGTVLIACFHEAGRFEIDFKQLKRADAPMGEGAFSVVYPGRARVFLLPN